MARLVPATVCLALAASMALADVEFCQASDPGMSVTCRYDTTEPGEISASGDWDVRYWVDGPCDVGTPSGSFASPADNNQLGNRALHEDAVPPGSCVRATVFSTGSQVTVSNVSAGSSAGGFCQASNPGPSRTCRLVATVDSDIQASGPNWRVWVWNNGRCDRGFPNSSFSESDNNLPEDDPQFALLSDVIPGGACARALAFSSGASVFIGDLRD